MTEPMAAPDSVRRLEVRKSVLRSGTINTAVLGVALFGTLPALGPVAAALAVGCLLAHGAAVVVTARALGGELPARRVGQLARRFTAISVGCCLTIIAAVALTVTTTLTSIGSR